MVENGSVTSPVYRRRGTHNQVIAPSLGMEQSIIWVAQFMRDGQVGDDVGHVEAPSDIISPTKTAVRRGGIPGGKATKVIRDESSVSVSEVDDNIGTHVWESLV